MKRNKNSSDKNVSSRYPNGRTIKTQDKHLPLRKNKAKELKEKRWVVIIDSNKYDDLAVVGLTTANQSNTSPLESYKKGNKKQTNFKHFVEITDNEGKPIRVDNKKFVENLKKYDLSAEEINQIQNIVFHHVKQSKSNNDKITELKKRTYPTKHKKK